MVEWVDKPPARTRKGSKWVLITDELRTRPGKWAKVDVASSTGVATMLKQGKLGKALPGEFEAKCRRNEDGGYDVYARFVGKNREYADAE